MIIVIIIMILIIIVSLTKLSIVIGSPRALIFCVLGARSHGCIIVGIQLQFFVIEYL